MGMHCFTEANIFHGNSAGSHGEQLRVSLLDVLVHLMGKLVSEPRGEVGFGGEEAQCCSTGQSQEPGGQPVEADVPFQVSHNSTATLLTPYSYAPVSRKTEGQSNQKYVFIVQLIREPRRGLKCFHCISIWFQPMQPCIRAEYRHCARARLAVFAG